jgi:hypothetical protein
MAQIEMGNLYASYIKGIKKKGFAVNSITRRGNNGKKSNYEPTAQVGLLGCGVS